MVKKLYQLQLQATILVLLAFAAPSKGDAIELYNWMNSAKKAQVITEGTMMNASRVSKTTVVTVAEVIQTGSIQAAKVNQSTEILVAFHGNTTYI